MCGNTGTAIVLVCSFSSISRTTPIYSQNKSTTAGARRAASLKSKSGSCCGGWPKPGCKPKLPENSWAMFVPATSSSTKMGILKCPTLFPGLSKFLTSRKPWTKFQPISPQKTSNASLAMNFFRAPAKKEKLSPSDCLSSVQEIWQTTRICTISTLIPSTSLVLTRLSLSGETTIPTQKYSEALSLAYVSWRSPGD